MHTVQGASRRATGHTEPRRPRHRCCVAWCHDGRLSMPAHAVHAPSIASTISWHSCAYGQLGVPRCRDGPPMGVRRKGDRGGR